MWLSPLFPVIARAAAFVYYRVRYSGDPVPPSGPVLLVANHRNSLLDPVLVAALARRPVRFLAKAPLFDDWKIGWLVKASGAVPVYRRIDDPGQMGRNEDTFRAVHSALGNGAAVGIFPEGLSHSEPTLVPLKTGAARIALGAFPLTRRAFPIVPVGLVFREKALFRSDALVLAGRPVLWDDLAGSGAEDAEAVRLLTERIADALRAVTINLERWQDQPLVECAVRVWEAERGAPPAPAERLTRLDVTTRILATVRESGDPAAAELAQDVETYRRRIGRLGLRPADLTANVGVSRGVSWAAKRVPLVMPLAAAIAFAGLVLFWVPYQLTGLLSGAGQRPEDQRATYKLLYGIALYALWVFGLAAVVAATVTLPAALLVLLGAPVVGMVGLVVRERWRGSWSDARRFLLLNGRRSLAEALRARQRELGARLDSLYRTFATRGVA